MLQRNNQGRIIMPSFMSPQENALVWLTMASNLLAQAGSEKRIELLSTSRNVGTANGIMYTFAFGNQIIMITPELKSEESYKRVVSSVLKSVREEINLPENKKFVDALIDAHETGNANKIDTIQKVKTDDTHMYRVYKYQKGQFSDEYLFNERVPSANELYIETDKKAVETLQLAADWVAERCGYAYKKPVKEDEMPGLEA